MQNAYNTGAVHFQLHNCNAQADKLFNHNLSEATSTEILMADYLMLQNRCLYEIEIADSKEDIASQLRREEGLSIDQMGTFETKNF